MSISQTVYINIVVKGGAASLAKPMTEVETVSTKAKGSVDKVQESLLGVNRMTATMTKALASMVGVIAVYEGIAIYIKLWETLVAVIVKGVQAAAEFEAKVLELSTVIATTSKFSEDVGENFRISTQVAEASMLQLISRAKELRVSTENVAYAYQLLLARGGGVGRFTQDAQKQLDLTILLSNAIATITPREQIRRQLSDEINALLTGQVKATSTLTALLFSSSAELKRFNEEGMRSGKWTEMLEQKLQAFIIAAPKLGTTLDGMITTLESMWTLFSKEAFSGVFNNMRNDVLALIDAINKSRDAQAAFAAAVDASLNLMYSKIVAIVKVFGEEGLTKIIGFLIEKILFLTAEFATLGDVAEAALRGKLHSPQQIAEMYFANLGKLYVEMAKKTADIVSKLYNPPTIPTTGVGGNVPKVVDEKGIKKAQDEIRKLQEEFALLGARNDEVLKITIQYLFKVEKLKEEYKNQQGYLQTILMIEKEIYNTKIRNIILSAQEKNVEAMRLYVLQEFPKQVEQNLKGMTTLFGNAYKEIKAGTHDATTAFTTLMKEIEDYGRTAIDITAIYRSELQETLRQYAMGNATMRDVIKAYNDLYLQTKVNAGVLEYLNELYKKTGIKELLDVIRTLTEAQRRSNEELRRTVDLEAQANLVMERWKQSMMSFLLTGKGFISMMKDFAEAAAVQIGQGMGNAFTQMFQAMQNGESAWAAFRKALGSILIQMGELAVSLGTISLLASFIPLFDALTNPAASAALIALGAGLIAAGVAMGGAGGKSGAANASGGSGGSGPTPQPIYINQQGIAVQQGIQYALEQNTIAIGNLNNEVGRLSKENGDTLVSNAINKSPSKMLQPLASKLSRSYSEQRSFGGAIFGES